LYNWLFESRFSNKQLSFSTCLVLIVLFDLFIYLVLLLLYRNETVYLYYLFINHTAFVWSLNFVRLMFYTIFYFFNCIHLYNSQNINIKCLLRFFILLIISVSTWFWYKTFYFIYLVLYLMISHFHPYYIDWFQPTLHIVY